MKRNIGGIGLGLIELLLVSEVSNAQFLYSTNNDGTLTITKYTGSDEVVLIPDSAYGLPITAIGPSAFELAATMLIITISSNITSIAAGEFR